MSEFVERPPAPSEGRPPPRSTPPPAPHERRPPDRLQLVANVLTILVALSAIALSVWQGREMRLHNRLSVLPNLDAFESQLNPDSVHTFSYGVQNTGLGPAVVRDVLVYENGERVFRAADSGGYPFDWERGALEEAPGDPDVLTSGYRVGDMLEAGEPHLLIRVTVEGNPDRYESYDVYPPTRVREILNARSYVVCYCSVYDEDCRATAIGAEPPEGSLCGF